VRSSFLNSRDPYGQFLTPARTLAGGSDSPLLCISFLSKCFNIYIKTTEGPPRKISSSAAPAFFARGNEWYYPPSLRRLGIN
jgi:hypothetical protein